VIHIRLKTVGALILVGLAVLIAVPALADETGTNFHGENLVLNSTTETQMYDSASAMVTSLQNKGLDVSGLGLTAALANMQSAIGSNATAFKDAMSTFRQDLMAGIKGGSIPGSDLGSSGNGNWQGKSIPALNATMETKMYNSASSMVTSLHNKGVDVSGLGLTAAVTNMQSAIGSNATAFKDAMMTFGKDIMTNVKDGSIPKSDLPSMGQCRGTGSSTSGNSHGHSGTSGSVPMV